jgi:multidrug efflux system outer membrane protein
MTARAASAALVLAAWGCTVGPDYARPETPSAPAYENAPQTGLAQDPAPSSWWREFGDARLNELIDQAVAGNRDVRSATALLREARALYDLETWSLLPSVTAHADYNRQMFSNATFLSGVSRDARTFGYFSAGFDAAWEIDVFGRVRREREAAGAETGVAAATREDVLNSLLAEVARNYFEHRGAQAHLEVARKNAEVQAETLRLTVARYEGGRGTDLDVSRARAELKSTLALIPPIETDAARAKNRLAVLLGRQPSGFALVAAPLSDRLPSVIAIGKPEDLLRRRPDIRAAERRLASATARIGVATADLFPRVTFTGSLGPQAQTLPGLFQSGAAAYTFGPSIRWAALDLGKVAARIRAADARAEADLNAYEQTVLLALEETENALVEFGRQRARRDQLIEAVQASEQAASLADTRYQAGATDFLTTLDAQRTLLSLQLQLAESRTRTVTALVALYKALGGGWETAGDR